MFFQKAENLFFHHQKVSFIAGSNVTSLLKTSMLMMMTMMMMIMTMLMMMMMMMMMMMTKNMR